MNVVSTNPSTVTTDEGLEATLSKDGLGVDQLTIHRFTISVLYVRNVVPPFVAHRGRKYRLFNRDPGRNTVIYKAVADTVGNGLANSSGPFNIGDEVLMTREPVDYRETKGVVLTLPFMVHWSETSYGFTEQSDCSCVLVYFPEERDTCGNARAIPVAVKFLRKVS